MFACMSPGPARPPAAPFASLLACPLAFLLSNSTEHSSSSEGAACRLSFDESHTVYIKERTIFQKTDGRTKRHSPSLVWSGLVWSVCLFVRRDRWDFFLPSSKRGKEKQQWTPSMNRLD